MSLCALRTHSLLPITCLPKTLWGGGLLQYTSSPRASCLFSQPGCACMQAKRFAASLAVSAVAVLPALPEMTVGGPGGKHFCQQLLLVDLPLHRLLQLGAAHAKGCQIKTCTVWGTSSRVQVCIYRYTHLPLHRLLQLGTAHIKAGRRAGLRAGTVFEHKVQM